MQNKISIKVGGPAGEGVFTVGLLLAKYFKLNGLEVVYTTDYPSLIKGGHNTCSIRAEDGPVYAEMKHHDVVACMDKLAVQEDVSSRNHTGIVVTDSKLVESMNLQDDFYVGIPIDSLIEDVGKRFKNTIVFGAIVGLISVSEEDAKEFISQTLSKHFGKKSQEIIDTNIDVALRGVRFVNEHVSHKKLNKIVKIENTTQRVMMTGNDAAALGALKAGLKFVSEYPMTPSTSFLSFFAAREISHNITTKHAEDEIAAINNVIGAAASGARAMTATSGGGYALMNEAISFAGMSENPVVIFECMRAGPSTGLPTYTDQGDLMHVLYSGSGEFPKVVFAPGDLQEAFYGGFEAFNIADLVQTPVVVLLDKHISASVMTTPRFDTSNLVVNRGNFQEFDANLELENYKRYELTQDGISKRVVIGQKGGCHVNSSYEHDESGWTSEDGEMHKLQMEKRHKKLNNIDKELIKPKILGRESDYDITLVSWGSNKSILQEATKYLEQDGIKVRQIHFMFLNPCDWEYVDEILRIDVEKNSVMLFEGNMTGQLHSLIRMNTGLNILEKKLKYDARPFFYEDVYRDVENFLKKRGMNIVGGNQK
ncbi:MAG: 2-oxoacid:acceptor oxidoreductase subunit alpha [Nanoarchaeota archaeon]|nr:2-oxoacid:acceptor oxidoreductase subunit alpha [Nanoarchaeota archaeon]